VRPALYKGVDLNITTVDENVILAKFVQLLGTVVQQVQLTAFILF